MTGRISTTHSAGSLKLRGAPHEYRILSAGGAKDTPESRRAADAAHFAFTTVGEGVRGCVQVCGGATLTLRFAGGVTHAGRVRSA